MRRIIDRYFFFLLAAACMAGVLPSCTDVLSGTAAGNGDDRIMVQFNVVPSRTKAALGDAAESTVGSIDLLVFRSATGTLDYRGRVTGSSYILASLLAGEELDWYIVANMPDGRFNAITTEAGFLSTLTYLSDTGTGSMVMGDSGTFTLVHGSTVREIGPVVLDRYACKVSISDITVAWLSDFDTPPSCTVDRVLVMNARTAVPLSGTATAAPDAYWLNRLTDEAADADPLSVEGRLAYDSPAVTVSSAATTALGAVVYAMPNGSDSGENAADTPWAPRRSRVCVRLTIGGVAQWYAIDLPAMERNTHYLVEDLVIMGPGTAAPDMGVDRTAVSFGVSVTEWSDEDIEADFNIGGRASSAVPQRP